MKNKKKAFFLAATAVLFWSTIGSVFKLSLKHTDPFELELLSIPVAVVVLSIALTLQGDWGLVLRSTKKELLHSLLLGILNPFLYYIVILYSYDLLRTQVATTLNFTWPIILVLLSALILKQRLTLASFIALAIGFLGACIIATGGSLKNLEFNSTLGLILVMGSTVIWAAFWVFNIRDKREPAVKLFLSFSFATPFSLLAWIIFHHPHSVPNVETLLGSLYIGVFEMGLTFLIWLKALSYAEESAEVANLIYLAPFIALFWIRILVKETIQPSTIIGLVFIVVGIVLQKKAQQKVEVK